MTTPGQGPAPSAALGLGYSVHMESPFPVSSHHLHAPQNQVQALTQEMRAKRRRGMMLMTLGDMEVKIRLLEEENRHLKAVMQLLRPRST